MDAPHWQFPALLRSRAQTGQLVRIRTKTARHLDLSIIEPADLLRVPPRFLAVRSTLRRHVTAIRAAGN